MLVRIAIPGVYAELCTTIYRARWDTDTVPFPKHIDNTIREAFVVCPVKARRAYIEDLAPIQHSVHLHAGGAFAAGLEAARRAFYERGLPPAEALALGDAALVAFYGDFEPPSMSDKTLPNMREALHYYFECWPLESDTLQPKHIEWRFQHPIPDVTHPDDQGPIYYVGRSDAPGLLAGEYTIEDDKTASSLGSTWMNQWDLDSQGTGYVWAAQQEGHMALDSSGPVLFRGVSILKPKFDKAGIYLRAASFGHAQVLTYRPPWVVQRWLGQLIRDVRRMVYAYLNNEWDYALHKNACAAYGGCPFKDLCLSQEPEAWIPVNYTKRKWNPLSIT